MNTTQETNTLQTITTTLKQRAKSLGLTNKVIAEKLELSAATVTNLFKGTASDIKSYMKLCELLNCQMTIVTHSQEGGEVASTTSATFQEEEATQQETQESQGEV